MHCAMKSCGRLALLSLFFASLLVRASFARQTSDSVSVELTIKVTAPRSVRAGETFPVHIELNAPVRVPRGYIIIGFLNSKEQVGLSGNLEASPDKTSYDIPIEIPNDAPEGIYTLNTVQVGSADGMHHAQLKFEPQSIEVIQPASFTLPSEAKVSINLSQKQLLRSAAIAVQHKIESLKAALVALQANSSPVPILRQNVIDADKALSTTEIEFLELSPTAEKANAKVFFEDLHKTYELASKQLKAGPLTRPVAFRGNANPENSGLESIVLRAFEHNELAYDVVADTGSLVFDLDVRTVPVGAKVSYGKRGDSTFVPLQDETNSVIKSLPYAIWIVRFEKDGYQSARTEHNPFTDKNHVLTVELVARKNIVVK